MAKPDGFVSWWDMKPYPLPASLDDLRGPSTGQIHLGHDVYWAPGTHDFSVDDVGQRRVAYRALLNEGTTAQVCELINKDLLVEIWPHLSLPLRLMQNWHARFPQLHNDLVQSV